MGTAPGPKDQRQDILSNQEREAQEQIKKMKKERLLITKVQGLAAQEIRDRLQQLLQQQLRTKQHQEAREREKQQSLLEQMACKEHQQVKQTKWHCSYFEQVVRKQQEQALKV
ncbi:hypothetical protein Y1Q_0010062 [Alligator mississippiensis]|uniref:Uncharacterized protein n=1 Tax=Alligator mississippiensis TaxID=8496 RepID=A0A151P400_ALLMI|nr:hypothetical protein Y1Q_0010062 [Alligator mississippiensis]